MINAAFTFYHVRLISCPRYVASYRAATLAANGFAVASTTFTSPTDYMMLMLMLACTTSQASPWFSRGSSCEATFHEVLKGWIPTLPSHPAPRCWSCRVSSPGGTLWHWDQNSWLDHCSNTDSMTRVLVTLEISHSNMTVSLSDAKGMLSEWLLANCGSYL